PNIPAGRCGMARERPQQHERRNYVIKPVFGEMLSVEFGIAIRRIAEVFPTQPLEETANPIQFRRGRLNDVERDGDWHKDLRLLTRFNFGPFGGRQISTYSTF